MSSSNNSRSSSLAIRFLQCFLKDRAEGRVRELTEYQAMFPSAGDVIADEYEAVMAEAPAATDDGPLSHPAQGDRYREEAMIGRGGMGTVLRVFDPSLERVVAMKRLTGPAGSLSDAQRLGRFLDEAKVTGQLQHPGIVSVLEIGLDSEQRPYFTMPLIEGRSLQQLIAAGRDGDPECTQVRLLEVLARVCEAVAYAHERGVIHRDLKPANIMVGRFGETYVVDWGLARDLNRPDRRDIRVRKHDDAGGEDSALRTMDGDVIGTPAYMAPEQARGVLDEIDRRSDVYSIGAMLYHVLVGSAPYAAGGKEQSSRATLDSLLSGPPRGVTVTVPNTRPELAAICERAMSPSAAQRYESAADLGADLRAFLENRVVLAHASGVFARLRKWMRRNRALAFVCIAGVLALGAALTWSELQRRTADANADLANQNLDLAFSAGDDLLGTLGTEELTNQPGADPLRTAVLARALAYYERVRDLRGDDPRVDRYVSKAHFRIADLKTRLGRNAEAKTAWQTAKASTAAAIAQHGETAALRLQLIAIEAELHIVAMQRGDLKTAVVGLEQALESLAAYRDSYPVSPDVVRNQLAYATNLALAMVELRDRSGALRHSDTTLVASRELVAMVPDSPGAKSLRGSALMQRGKLMWQLGNVDKASERYREATEVFEEAMRSHPDYRGMRSWFGDLLNLRGILRMQQGDHPGAKEVFERAHDIYEELVAAHPGVRNLHGQFGGVLCNLGIIQSLRQDYDGALQRLTAAMTQLDLCLAIDPDAVDYLRYRTIACQELAMAHLATGQHAAAAAVTRRWVEREPDGNRYTAGRLFARCAEVSASDGSLPEDQQEALSLAYADEAMTNLLAAHKRKRVQLEQLQGRSFHVLRTRDDYRQLVDDLSR